MSDGTQADAELAALRELLVVEETQEIADLRERIETRSTDASDVADVLPDAFLLRASRDDALGRALAPTIDDAIQESVERDPSKIAEAIFPVIGPAIRKAIRQALAQTIETLNTTVEHSVSPRGLRWRLEAWRTGRPFAEVVLSHSLLWRVEQLFLIHGETGVVLEEVAAPGGLDSDSDLVASMLTAIQDFCADSFQTDAERPVHEIGFDEFQVLVASGPRAAIAAVVRGRPPGDFRERLDEAIEGVHARFSHALVDFEGETDDFVLARPLLEACLDEERRSKPKSAASFLPGLVAAGLLLFGGYYLSSTVLSRRAQTRADRQAFARLESVEGVFLGEVRRAVSADELGDEVDWVLEGLRDPDADDPLQVLRDAGFDPARAALRWEPIRGFAPALVARRAARLLEAPQGLTFRVENDRLIAQGFAPPGWIAAARERLALVDGVRELIDETGDGR